MVILLALWHVLAGFLHPASGGAMKTKVSDWLSLLLHAPLPLLATPPGLLPLSLLQDLASLSLTQHKS